MFKTFITAHYAISSLFDGGCFILSTPIAYGVKFTKISDQQYSYGFKGQGTYT